METFSNPLFSSPVLDRSDVLEKIMKWLQASPELQQIASRMLVVFILICMLSVSCSQRMQRVPSSRSFFYIPWSSKTTDGFLKKTKKQSKAYRQWECLSRESWGHHLCILYPMYWSIRLNVLFSSSTHTAAAFALNYTKTAILFLVASMLVFFRFAFF